MVRHQTSGARLFSFGERWGQRSVGVLSIAKPSLCATRPGDNPSPRWDCSLCEHKHSPGHQDHRSTPRPLPVTSGWGKLNRKEIQLGRFCLTLKGPSESLAGAIKRSDGISSFFCSWEVCDHSGDLLPVRPQQPQTPKWDLLPSCSLDPPKLSVQQKKELPSPGK